MMTYLYFAVSYFPAWAVPLAYILFEVGRWHRRRKENLQGYFAYFWTILLIGLTLFYIFDEGYRYWVPALQAFERENF